MKSSIPLVLASTIFMATYVSGGIIDDLMYLGKFLKKSWSPSDEELPIRILVDKRTQSDLLEGLSVSNTTTPVLLWHGMGDTAFGGLDYQRKLIQEYLPGTPVLSVQIGNDENDDEMGGFLVGANYQVEEACKEILKNKIIKAHGSFNAIAYSQGNQMMRAMIERCPLRENGIRVKNYISLGGQHQGVYGLPFCKTGMKCEILRKLLSSAAYTEIVQKRLVQAAYWHDPMNEETYKTKNLFLADINCELHDCPKYRDNLLQLDNLVLVVFGKDKLINPKVSQAFGFFKPGSIDEVMEMKETPLYKEDKIGLKELDETKRLRIFTLPTNHLEVTDDFFIEKIIRVYLNKN